MIAARRRATILLLAAAAATSWGVSALLFVSTTAPEPSSTPRVVGHGTSFRSPRPQIEAPPTTMPVPAPLADSWLSMRAGPVPVPIELRMPSLGVSAAVLGVGVTARGEMDAPQGRAGDPVWQTGFWYRGSAVPGATSTALIAGHASAPKGGPAIFERLDQLRSGDLVVVHDTRTGLDVTFAVAELAIYTLDQARDPSVLARIYGTGPATGAWSQPSTDGLAHLTLITCAGTYRSADGTHDHRLVVFATRVG